MKHYQKPATEVVIIETVHMIATSGDEKTDVVISNSTIDNTTFGSRRGNSSWDDEE